MYAAQFTLSRKHTKCGNKKCVAIACRTFVPVQSTHLSFSHPIRPKTKEQDEGGRSNGKNLVKLFARRSGCCFWHILLPPPFELLDFHLKVFPCSHHRIGGGEERKQRKQTLPPKLSSLTTDETKTKLSLRRAARRNKNLNFPKGSRFIGKLNEIPLGSPPTAAFRRRFLFHLLSAQQVFQFPYFPLAG